MHIVPHPMLEYPETIEMEYGMESGLLTVQVRAALAGYSLRRWGGGGLLKGAQHEWGGNSPVVKKQPNFIRRG